jgi:D-3-phosphoglycerate dehydrogenase
LRKLNEMTETQKRTFTVVITGPALAEPAMQKLAAKCRVVNIKPYTPSEEIAQILKDQEADGLIVRMGKINPQVIRASRSLKVITKHGTGVDNIDLAAATQLKIPVMITPYANFESVAEHSLGLMLSVSRAVCYLDRRMREGHWDKTTARGAELFEKTLGIVGYGRIGRRLGEIVKPLNMGIVAFDPLVKPEGYSTDVTFVSEFDDLLRASDYISLNCPLTPQTANLIGSRELKTMKKTAFLINTARGGIVDERALTEALETGEIAGAGIDSFGQEPPDGIHPLAKFDNVIITPHIGGVTHESFTRMGLQAVKNVLDVLEGRSLDVSCVINHEIL